MFSVIFKGFKRVVDLTLLPGLIGVVFFLLEKALGAVTWVIVLIGDFLIGIIGWALSFVEFPDISLDETTFGQKFFDIAEVVGLWPAMGVYFMFAAVAFIARIVTLGTVGNR